MRAGHNHSCQGIRGTRIKLKEDFVVEGGELSKAEEGYGETDESRYK